LRSTLKRKQPKTNARRLVGSSSRPARATKTHAKSRSSGRNVKTVSVKHQKAVTTVSRARATTPARSAHAPAHPKKLRERVPSPMPTRHVAPPQPVLMSPARSMPPSARDPRKLAVPPSRGPLVVPEFAEAGVVLAITYSIRDGRRGEFFDLMKELKPLLAGIGGTDCTVYEDRSRPNYFMEVFRFRDETEFTAFDDKFHKDRKIAAIYALLDDIVEAEKSDFKIFERRL